MASSYEYQILHEDHIDNIVVRTQKCIYGKNDYCFDTVILEGQGLADFPPREGEPLFFNQVEKCTTWLDSEAPKNHQRMVERVRNRDKFKEMKPENSLSMLKGI